MAYKYKIKEEEGHSKYYPGGKTPGLTTSVMNQILKKIADSGDEDKKVKNKLKENYLSGKSFITSKLENYPKALSKVNQLIDMVGEVNFTMDIAKWVYDFFNNASFESPVNEAQSNPTDIISVDVPLFIRLLEYSREDAKTDMDLHDVAENIIRLSAEGKPLTMANYDDIIGANKEVNEEGEGGSMSNAAGGYLGKYAYKLPKKQPKLEEETEAPKPNAKNPGATLGAGPSAGKSGVTKNAYVKQFKYKVVPQTAEGTYVQKGSGMEVKKLF
jgi:hypothetical protein